MPNGRATSRTNLGESLFCESFYSTPERMISAISSPAYAVLSTFVCLMAVVWALLEGTIGLDATIFSIARSMSFAMTSFCICSFVAWAVHAITHHLVLSEQDRQPASLLEAATMGPWNVRRTFGAIMMPFYWCHAMHHHQDANVNRRTSVQIAEIAATAFLGGAYTISLAAFAPTVLHLGSAIAFFVMYVSGHLLNFHYKWTDIHTFHHQDPNGNLSPNAVDLLFGTTDRIEDIWHMMPNAIFGCAVAISVAYLMRHLSARSFEGSQKELRLSRLLTMAL